MDTNFRILMKEKFVIGNKNESKDSIYLLTKYILNVNIVYIYKNKDTNLKMLTYEYRNRKKNKTTRGIFCISS